MEEGVKKKKKKRKLKHLNTRFQTNGLVYFAVSIAMKQYGHEKK